MKAAYTIVTQDYLFLASLLGVSFKKHNPSYRFYICMIGNQQKLNKNRLPDDLELLIISDMDIPGMDSMKERYSKFELCCALKPFCADYLISFFNLEFLLYFDADILVFNDFTFIESMKEEYKIMLTPHILSPIDDIEKTPTEMNFLCSGLYNAGFWGIAPSEESAAFITWWKERLWYLCYLRNDQGLNVDQLWLNFVPIYFGKVLVIRHPGYNMAGHNLHERFITIKDDQFFVNNDYPLVFYHYTDFNVSKMSTISASQTRYKLKDRSDLTLVLEEYASKFL